MEEREERSLRNLCARATASAKYPLVFRDRMAEETVRRNSLSVPSLSENEAVREGLYEAIAADSIRTVLRHDPNALIIRIGCGFDTLFPIIDNGHCRYLNLDHKEIIDLRNGLMACRIREDVLPCDYMSGQWLEEVDHSRHVIAVFMDSLLYEKKEEVHRLIDLCARSFKACEMLLEYRRAGIADLFSLFHNAKDDAGGRWILDRPEIDLSVISGAIVQTKRITHLPELYEKALRLEKRQLLSYQMRREAPGFAILMNHSD